MNQTSSRIVIGYDGSAGADAAIDWAAENLAVDTGAAGGPAELLVVLVGTAMDPVLSGYRHVMDRAVEQWRSAAEERLATRGVTGATVEVRPGPVLVDASRAASLVVVGSRGRDAFTEMLLGSVTQHVLHHAQCPVAILR